jgi:hypothetical protein
VRPTATRRWQPTRIEHPFIKSDLAAIEGDELVAAGYQGIWATENTREALFDAMARKETYATTGPRMVVRFFGGWEYTDDDLRSRAPAFRGYEKGVPMGGDLTMAPAGKAPTFMVYALRDPIGANLDRIQIVKGWVDDRGKTQEKVYDVAWSATPSVHRSLPPSGATRTSTRISARSTTLVYSRSRRRAGCSTTRSGSASNYPNVRN